MIFNLFLSIYEQKSCQPDKFYKYVQSIGSIARPLPMCTGKGMHTWFILETGFYLVKNKADPSLHWKLAYNRSFIVFI